MNTLVSEIFKCEKIKRSMTLYMNFWSQRVNKVYFPSPFNNRTILSYCSVMHIIKCALFSHFLISVCHAKHKFKKNHAKIIQKATIFQSPTQQSLSNHSWDIISWNKQKNSFTHNIIAQIPHSDNCQILKTNKYFKP